MLGGGRSMCWVDLNLNSELEKNRGVIYQSLLRERVSEIAGVCDPHSHRKKSECCCLDLSLLILSRGGHAHVSIF